MNSISMEHSPGNDGQNASSRAKLSDKMEKRHAAALLVLREVCSDKGLDLVGLNSRPEVIGRRTTAGNVETRTCLICNGPMLNQESWVFTSKNKKGACCPLLRSAHAGCVDRSYSDMFIFGDRLRNKEA
jgi:hypothetical protein